jgi:hypothetical protein
VRSEDFAVTQTEELKAFMGSSEKCIIPPRNGFIVYFFGKSSCLERIERIRSLVLGMEISSSYTIVSTCWLSEIVAKTH